jgi:membrane protein DedA with SNARE-associated domain
MALIAHIVRHALEHWGYFAVAVALLGEDAGLPLPGETVLMLASFVGHKTHHLSLAPLIIVGIASAAAGDNLGYYLGRRLGPRLLRWMRGKLDMGEDVDAATEQIRRHGRATVFWARYIVGLRTIAGPLAGALGMEWKPFLVFNVLGAATWVTSMALAGYAFAKSFHSFMSYFEKGSWTIAGAIFTVSYVIWRRKKKQFRERSEARG